MMAVTGANAGYPGPALRTLPLRERPAQRVKQDGARACNLVELLAAIVGGPRQIEIAHALLAEFGDLVDLARAPVRRLEKVPGLGPAGAARLKAALGLAQRLAQDEARRRKLCSADDMAALVLPEMKLLEQEEMWVILLDTQFHLLGIERVFRGNVNGASVGFVEVFRPAVEVGASTIVVVHNHPGGDPTPSKADVQVTKTLVSAGSVLGVEVLDHLIVGREGYVSMRERRKSLRLGPYFPDRDDGLERVAG
jgi:DNA repair protein RadC